MKGEIHQASEIEHIIILLRVLHGLVEVSLGVLQHLSLGLWFDRLVHSVPDDGDRAEKVRVTIIRHLLAALSEERNGVLVLSVGEAFQPLAQNLVVERTVVELLDLAGLDIVSKTILIILCDKVAIGSVQEDKVVDIVRREIGYLLVGAAIFGLRGLETVGHLTDKL